MNKSKILAAIMILVIAFAAGIYFGGGFREAGDAPDIAGFLWPDPPKIGQFSLDRANGEHFSELDLENHWTLLFFGFVNCPDVCPTTMSLLNQVYENLRATPALFDNLQIVFVSVDPERDEPETLRSYVEYFNPKFIGVTAPDSRLKAFAKQFGVLYVKINSSDGQAYSMDHSASILMVSPDLRFVGIFSQPHDTADITDRIKGIATFLETGQ